jgi:hypothetical protein
VTSRENHRSTGPVVSAGQLSLGLREMDDDLVGVPNTLEVGTADVLTGATVIPAVPKPGHLLHLPLSRNSSWVRRFRCKAPLTG